MAREPFAHKFPEWVLSWSLKEACEDGKTKEFWEVRTVTLTNRPGSPTSLAQVFPSVSGPKIHWERTFRKDDAKTFGIDDETFRRTFWGLRPDFTIIAETPLSLFLLEAKGGSNIPDWTWDDPKERTYYNLLRTCQTPSPKGFFFLVPDKYEAECRRCLSSSDHFPHDDKVVTGFILWEDIIEVIGGQILHTVVSELQRELVGLRDLGEALGSRE